MSDPAAGASEVAGLRRVLLLSVADDELVTGHRSSFWTGVAPGLEEDLAYSTLAQDELNHADVWLQVLAGTDPDRDLREQVDALAFGRAPDAYRHAVVCERPPTDFAFTLARHWAYDHFDAVRLDALAASSDEEIAAVARKLRHEERYHLEHADHWVDRCLAAGGRARDRLADGLARVLPEALWLCEPLPGEPDIVTAGLIDATTAELRDAWLERLVPTLRDAGLVDVLPDALHHGDRWRLPDGFFDEPGGRHGYHSPDFTDDVWPTMTGLYRDHPGARW